MTETNQAKAPYAPLSEKEKAALDFVHSVCIYTVSASCLEVESANPLQVAAAAIGDIIGLMFPEVMPELLAVMSDEIEKRATRMVAKPTSEKLERRRDIVESAAKFLKEKTATMINSEKQIDQIVREN